MPTRVRPLQKLLIEMQNYFCYDGFSESDDLAWIEEMEEEKVLLEEKGIIITNQRAIFGVNAYEISTIQSVTKIMMEQDEATKRKVRAMWLFGAMGLLCFVADYLQNPTYSDVRLWFIFGILFLLIAGLINQNVEYYYIVQINDNDGIHNAYQSQDSALTQRIVKAINQAITELG